jgi:adenylate kinase family enzyme/GNAT superfamily N-acetyltransferase
MIRLADKFDLDTIDKLSENAINAMRKAFIKQWDFSYPRKPHFFKDIEDQRLYVYENDDGSIVGVMAVLEHEPHYETISWAKSKSLIIHRLITDPKVQNQGIGSELMMHAIRIAKTMNKESIKIDTHPGNSNMRAFIKKHQFRYRGYLKSIHRNAYERIVDSDIIKKVAIFGSSGTGKTTLARRLGTTLNLEVLHLDTVYWKENWTTLPKPEFTRRIRQFMQTHERFVMDGNYTNSKTLADRLAMCDTFILLRYDADKAIKGILERETQYKHRYRSDMAEGCYEDVDQEFLQYVAFFDNKKHKIEGLLNHLESKKHVLIFDDRKALHYWLNSL